MSNVVLQPTCRWCGHRHFSNSRNNMNCRYYARVADWQASAAGIAALAADARTEAIGWYNAARQSVFGGVRHARCLSNATAAFERAYQLEN